MTIITKRVCSLLVGLAIWFAPVPVGLAPQAWHLFAIFAAVIFAVIIDAMPDQPNGRHQDLLYIQAQRTAIDSAIQGYSLFVNGVRLPVVMSKMWRWTLALASPAAG